MTNKGKNGLINILAFAFVYLIYSYIKHRELNLDYLGIVISICLGWLISDIIKKRYFDQ